MSSQTPVAHSKIRSAIEDLEHFSATNKQTKPTKQSQKLNKQANRQTNKAKQTHTYKQTKSNTQSQTNKQPTNQTHKDKQTNKVKQINRQTKPSKFCNSGRTLHYYDYSLKGKVKQPKVREKIGFAISALSARNQHECHSSLEGKWSWMNMI